MLTICLKSFIDWLRGLKCSVNCLTAQIYTEPSTLCSITSLYCSDKAYVCCKSVLSFWYNTSLSIIDLIDLRTCGPLMFSVNPPISVWTFLLCVLTFCYTFASFTLLSLSQLFCFQRCNFSNIMQWIVMKIILLVFYFVQIKYRLHLRWTC